MDLQRRKLFDAEKQVEGELRLPQTLVIACNAVRPRVQIGQLFKSCRQGLGLGPGAAHGTVTSAHNSEAKVNRGRVGLNRKEASSLRAAIRRSSSSKSGQARAKAREDGGLGIIRGSLVEVECLRDGAIMWMSMRLDLGRK